GIGSECSCQSFDPATRTRVFGIAHDLSPLRALWPITLRVVHGNRKSIAKLPGVAEMRCEACRSIGAHADQSPQSNNQKGGPKQDRLCRLIVVLRPRFELGTPAFSVQCSTD